MSRRAELSPQNSFREQGDCRPAHPRAPGRRPAHFPAREHAAPAADQRCAAQQSRSALQAAGCTARAPHPYTHMSYVAASHALAPAASFARRCRIRHSHPCIRAHSCAACWPCPLPAGIGTSRPLDHPRTPPPAWPLLSELATTSTDAARSVQLVPTPDRRPHLARYISMSPLSSSLFPPCSGGA